MLNFIQIKNIIFYFLYNMQLWGVKKGLSYILDFF